MASPPLYMTYVSPEDMARGDGELVTEFTETYCRVTKDGYGCRAGELMRLRPWQKTLTAALYARRPDGRRKHRRALIGMARKSGKSGIVSSFALHGLVTGGMGSEVYGAARDRDQARIVFSVAKKMVELDPQLSGIVKPYRDVLEIPATGSIYRVLSSDAFSQEGLNPTFVCFDELHASPTDELYNVLSDAFGARKDPLLVGITTAGVKTDQQGGDSIAYRLYQYGRSIASGEIDDPTFLFAWWGADDNDDPGDPAIWEKANPAYGDLQDPEDFESLYRQAEKNGTVQDFRTKRLNQWVTVATAWLPQGAWAACKRDFRFAQPPKGVVLGFHGSRSGDSTALVAVTVEPDPKVRVLGSWERPVNDKGGVWKAPRGEIKEAIREACRMYDVREIAWGEFLWNSEADELDEAQLPVVIFPNTPAKMSPATQRAFEMINSGRLWHDGDPRLARHLDNAVVKTDQRGTRLTTDSKSSSRRVHLAVAMVIALDRAAYWLQEDGPGMYMGKKISELQFCW